MKFRHLSRQEPRISVTPYAGVWIEIRQLMNVEQPKQVTPYAGVWIEILYNIYEMKVSMVTPYAGVWIEIRIITTVNKGTKSLPTRECGLKYVKH